MSQSTVLARKWRPKNFSALVGQEHVVRALVSALEKQRLHHAYLFTGTRGVGKTTVARILAKALNCETGVTPAPCGVCQACTAIDNGRFVDLVELDAASNTQVDNMRELLEGAMYAPTAARYKVYIIDEVHMLSKSAFNAMLKTLEEPPAHVKFILATTDPQKIPVTVLSRCLQFNLKQIPPSLITAYLKYVLQQEQISHDAASLPLLSRAAAGSMRDALSILDQAIAYGQGSLEESVVRHMLGTIDQGYLYDLLDALGSQDGARMLEVADSMEARSLSFDTALQDMAALLHRLAIAQTVPEAISEDLPERETVLSLAQRFTPEEIQLFYQIALHGRHDLGLAPDEYAGFTMTLMRMLAFIPETALVSGKTGETGEKNTQRTAMPALQPAIRHKAEAGNASSDKKASPSKVLPSSVSSATATSAETIASANRADNTASGTAASASINSLVEAGWPALASRMKLTGMAKMLAQHCELKQATADSIELCVPEMHKHLLDKPYQDKIRTALSEVLGSPVRVSFSVGMVTGMTPAEMENREKQAKQLQAVAAIEADPFVRDLVEHLDATLIHSSIKPVE